MTADVQRPTPPLTEEPVRRRHDGPCPECEGTDAILHGGRVLECRACGWEWAYAGRSMGDVQAEIEQLSAPSPPLTDEELAEILELAEDTPGHTVVLFRSDVFRLIADLRASRAELATYKELVWGNECGCVGSAFRRAGVPIEP